MAGHLRNVETGEVIRVTKKFLEWQLQIRRAEEKNPQFPLLLFSKPIPIGRRKCLKGHFVREGNSLSMYLTWIAIIASLLMGIGAVLIFIFAVKKDYFKNLEEAKYQVFWSDVEELIESSREEQKDGEDALRE